MNINSLRRSKSIFLGAVLLAASIVAISAGAKVSAAGSTAFTAEGASSAHAGTQFTATVYVNPSGASFLNGQLTLNLTNLTFQGFNAAGGWSGAAPVNGCGVGATTCTLSFYNLSGVSTKTSVGTLTINATGAAGSSGQINLSGALADDSNGDPMSASTANRTISIIAPATPPPSGGGGGGGGSSGGGSPTTPPAGSNPNTSNPIDNPNPDSTVSVPNDDGEGQIVSENDYSLMVANASAETANETVASTKQPSNSLPIKIAGGLLLVALAAVAAKIILTRVAASRALNKHVVPGAFGDGLTGPKDQPAANTDNNASSEDNQPGGPTIIRPQQ